MIRTSPLFSETDQEVLLNTVLNVGKTRYQQEKREDQGKDDKIETMETNSESDDVVIHRQDGYEDTNPSSRQSSTKKIYEQEKREDQGKDEKSETMETNSEDTVIHRQDGYDNTNPSSRQSSTNRSEINTDFIAKHVNSIVNTLADMMNCSLSKCDEAEHKRHHEFIRSPEKMYADNYLKYCFGAKYIEPEDFEYLQQILGERICVNKFLPGSIFSRYSSFKNLDNEELEKIFIDSPLMGHEYFKFVILKEAVTYLVCCNTGLPYEESDERCSQTEASVAQHKRVQEGCFPFNL